jgi:hypothetical protein
LRRYLLSPEAVDGDTPKIREVWERAYQRWKLAEQGIMRGIGGRARMMIPTSDYGPEENMEEDENQEEFEEDEDMEDLDVEDLKTEMAEDIEDLRVELEGYRIVLSRY